GTVKKGGSVGDAAIFSFFPTKNLGAYGDGGMIVTDDDEIADFCRSFRVHGSKKKYIHDVVGINSRLDELQAAFLRVKFKQLEEYEKDRKKIAIAYAKLFEEAGLGSRVWGLDKELDSTRPKNLNPKPGFVLYPGVPSDNSHVFHQYVVRFNGFSRKQRDYLRGFLKENGIGTSIYYPMGLHQQKCFEEYVPDGLVLPETEKACEETLALPIFPEMTDEEVEYVADTINKYLKLEKRV
ncbi:MAG: DegT/DnrJ/EryC1/StrS family aminotransferase, partial [Kosmotogaceae bacterium]